MPGLFGTSVLPSLLPKAPDPSMWAISGLNPAARVARCLRFTVGLLFSAQDSLLGWWPTFAGRGSHPLGSLQKVSRWLRHRSSLSELFLAQGAEPPAQ